MCGSLSHFLDEGGEARQNGNSRFHVGASTWNAPGKEDQYAEKLTERMGRLNAAMEAKASKPTPTRSDSDRPPLTPGLRVNSWNSNHQSSRADAAVHAKWAREMEALKRAQARRAAKAK